MSHTQTWLERNSGGTPRSLLTPTTTFDFGPNPTGVVVLAYGGDAVFNGLKVGGTAGLNDGAGYASATLPLTDTLAAGSGLRAYKYFGSGIPTGQQPVHYSKASGDSFVGAVIIVFQGETDIGAVTIVTGNPTGAPQTFSINKAGTTPGREVMAAGIVDLNALNTVSGLNGTAVLLDSNGTYVARGVVMSKTAPAGTNTTLEGQTQAAVYVMAVFEVVPGTPAAPTITGPATFNLAENATAGPTFTTDIDLGSGYPQKSGVDAALFNLVSTGTRQWQFQKIAAANYEGAPEDAGANRVYDVTFVADGSTSASCAITLTNVNEPPGAPTALAATPGNASASVAFTAPAPNGGPSPTSYTITSSPGGIQATGPVSPIVVPGLTNGVAYTFTGTASSSEGTSVASAASNSVTPSLGSFAAALAAVATDYTGSTRRLNAAFDWVASPWTTPLAQATATRVSGSGTTSAVDGTASIALPSAGAWEVRQYFKDGSGNVIGMSRQFPTAA